MAATTLAVQDFSTYLEGQTARALIAPATSDADEVNGNDFTNDGRTYVWADNPTGGPLTITPAIEAACVHGQTHAIVLTVAANSRGLLGPFPFRRFSASTGRVTLQYSGAGLLVAAVRL